MADEDVCLRDVDPATHLELEEIAQKLKTGPFSAYIKDRKSFFKTFTKCFIGEDLVRFLVHEQYVSTTFEAIELGQRLLDNFIIRHVTNEHPFKDEKLFYRFLSDDDQTKGPTVAALKQSCGVLRSGALLKKGLIFWGSRYFICKADEGKLYVYEKKTSSSPCDIITLTGSSCGIKETGECKSGYYCFVLTSASHGEWVLCTQKSENQEKWMRALNEAGAAFQEENFNFSPEQTSIFAFSALDIDEKLKPIKDFSGSVCMVVNVASK